MPTIRLFTDGSQHGHAPSAPGRKRNPSHYRGWYPRDRQIYELLETREMNLFDLAVHDFVSGNAQTKVDPDSNLPPGVWVGSASKIVALTGRQEEERRIRRSLEKLERLGLMQRFSKKGKRGDYPILIHGFIVRDSAGNSYRINARETTSWKDPKLEPVREGGKVASATRPGTVRDASGFLQEVKIERREKSNGQPPTIEESSDFERAKLALQNDTNPQHWKNFVGPAKCGRRDGKLVVVLPNHCFVRVWEKEFRGRIEKQLGAAVELWAEST